MIKINANTDSYTKSYIDAHQNFCDNIKFYETGEDLVELSVGAGDIGYFNHASVGWSFQGLNEISEPIVAFETEGLHTIVPFLDQIPIDKKYIFFCTNHWDWNKYRFPFEYTVIESNFQIWDRLLAHFNLYHFSFFTNLDYDFDCPKPYYLYAPVGIKRPLREIFVDKLQQFAENSVIRFGGIDMGKRDYNRLSIEQTNDGDRFKSWAPLPGYEKYFISLGELIPLKTMNQARITVAVETQIDYLDSFFYTEKTIKCLLTGAPFVCYGNQHHLKNFRNLGFKTYNEVWDESYDDILDPVERGDAVIKLLKSLKDFDWKTAKSKLLEIKHHNTYNILRFRNREREVFKQNSDRLKKFLSRE